MNTLQQKLYKLATTQEGLGPPYSNGLCIRMSKYNNWDI